MICVLFVLHIIYSHITSISMSVASLLYREYVTGWATSSLIRVSCHQNCHYLVELPLIPLKYIFSHFGLFMNNHKLIFVMLVTPS